MDKDPARIAEQLMAEFARDTGLDPERKNPRRYLWTDAFAVCNYLGFFRESGDLRYRDLAVRLIDQVHHTLGRFRPDDSRTGWISGLSGSEAEEHPTAGGLRIGKPLPERGPGEAPDEEKEWDQDGQYFHYLTKWMYALGEAGRVTGNPAYTRWGIELARAAFAGFMHRSGGQELLYWKMSTDLIRPLVRSMGQHDPLDGLVTFSGLQHLSGDQALEPEIRQLAAMTRAMPLATGDPLGTGGLLSDSLRIARLTDQGVSFDYSLLSSVLTAARDGLAAFSRTRTLELPAEYRLAFREFGLTTGLAAAEQLGGFIGQKPELTGTPAARELAAVRRFLPLKEQIELFWLDEGNRAAGTWTSHREINTVMLATSLAPGGFLGTGI